MAIAILKKLKPPTDTPETLRAEIAAAEEEARTARTKSVRLAEVAATELDDENAEEALRRSRAPGSGRAPGRGAESAASRTARQGRVAGEAAPFREVPHGDAGCRDAAHISIAGCRPANYAALSIRNEASSALGTDVGPIPMLAFLGIGPMPDTFAIWRKHTERALEAMEKTEYPAAKAARSGRAAGDLSKPARWADHSWAGALRSLPRTRRRRNRRLKYRRRQPPHRRQRRPRSASRAATATQSPGAGRSIS